MKQLHLSFAAAAAVAFLALAPALIEAQQVLTWDQVKATFEASNPTLKADPDPLHSVDSQIAAACQLNLTAGHEVIQ
jgi:hypothetical protein